MNFSNLDAPYNLQYYHKDDVNTEVAYMGCVQGSETITYKIGESLYAEGIGRAFERLSKLGKVESTGVTEYINLENTREEVTILDSYSGGFVKCKKILKNPNRDNWHKVEFTGGRSLVATADHPLPIKGKGRTFVKDMIVGDIGYLATTDSKVNNEIEITYIDKIVLDEPSYDVETESDRFDVSGIMSHNCRTRVMANVYNPSYEKTSGRGNLSFTSINLPRLGIRAHGSIDRFFKLLDEMLELVHHQLLARFKVQCRKHPRNFPFLMGQGVWIDSDKLGLDDDMTEILKNGTLTVGFIGLAECLKALIGVHHGESEEAQQLGLKIIGHMREMTDKWSQVEHMNYSLIATPAEGLAGRFIRIDKKKYGIIPGVTDRDYYTNSMHVPVYYPINAFKKINIEAPYHALCNGGHITYIELDGDPTKNLDAFMKVVRYMHDAGIGYGAINHPVDRDPICGYQGIIDDVCPRCGRKEDEPMTEEMWQKIKGYPSWANAGHCGTCGDPYEEADRTPNSLTISGDK